MCAFMRYEPSGSRWQIYHEALVHVAWRHTGCHYSTRINSSVIFTV